MRFFLCLFCTFHRRYWNRRPLNSARYNRIICQTVENTSFLRGCRAYCTRWRKVAKVTNPISDFTFLSTAKSGKSRIKNPFLDSPKGTHPWCLLASCVVIFPIRCDLSDFLYPEFSLIKRGQGQTHAIWTTRRKKFQVKISPRPKFHLRIPLQRFNFHFSSLAKQSRPCERSQTAVCFPIKRSNAGRNPRPKPTRQVR